MFTKQKHGGFSIVGKKRKFVATAVVIELIDEDEREAKQEHG